MQSAFLKLNSQLAVASSGLAQGVSPIPEDNWGTILTVAAVLGALLALSVWTAFSQKGFGAARQANNLFLKISYVIGNTSELLTGYLRSLAVDQASFVTQQDFKRGDRIQLLMDSLPNFPERHFRVDAEVTESRLLRGDKVNHLVHVRFRPSQTAPDPTLGYYLKILND